MIRGMITILLFLILQTLYFAVTGYLGEQFINLLAFNFGGVVGIGLLAIVLAILGWIDEE
jgi:hypothetical protein